MKSKGFNSILLGISALISVLLSLFIVKKVNSGNLMNMVITSIIAIVVFIIIYGVLNLLFIH